MVLGALLLAACQIPLRQNIPNPAQTQPSMPAPDSVDALAAAVASDARRSDQESDAKIRGDLAEQAKRDADACLALAPQAPPCLYYHAVALGLEARAHPTRASELLKSMLEALAAAEATDPEYDEAGPARVRALVLVRAPSWPLGPGDTEAGVTAARRAVALRPQYPPNLIALGEALTKTGDPQGALDSYTRARAAAQALPPTNDRSDWLREADRALLKERTQ